MGSVWFNYHGSTLRDYLNTLNESWYTRILTRYVLALQAISRISLYLYILLIILSLLITSYSLYFILYQLT